MHEWQAYPSWRRHALLPEHEALAALGSFEVGVTVQHHISICRILRLIAVQI
jgi:hypothetical protein